MGPARSSEKVITRRLTHLVILRVVAGFVTACGDGGSATAPAATPGRLTETLESVDMLESATGERIERPPGQRAHGNLRVTVRIW